MIDKILLAFDGSDNAYRALDLTADLADKYEASLLIVHVLMHGRPSREMARMAEVEHLVSEAHSRLYPDLDYVAGQYFEHVETTSDPDRTAQIIDAVGEQLLARAKERCAEVGVIDVKTALRNGDYADEILDAADDYAADLVVVGSRGLGAIRGTVLGSVSQKVLHHVKTNVLAVK